MLTRDLFKEVLDAEGIDMDAPMGGLFPVKKTTTDARLSQEELAQKIIRNEKLSEIRDRATLRSTDFIGTLSAKYEADREQTLRAVSIVERLTIIAMDIYRKGGRSFAEAATARPKAPIKGIAKGGKLVRVVPYDKIVDDYKLNSQDVTLVLAFLSRVLRGR